MNRWLTIPVSIWVSVSALYIATDVFNDYYYEKHNLVAEVETEEVVINDEEFDRIVENDYQEQVQCLAINIYHEARSDSRLGQEAVGLVTMNRVYDTRYPDTVCDVVYQAHVDRNGNPIRNKCQFSWYCDGKRDDYRDVEAFNEIYALSEEIYGTYHKIRDFTDGAVMYHASYVKPYWASHYAKTSRIESHIFYK